MHMGTSGVSHDGPLLEVENLRKYFIDDDSWFARLNPFQHLEYVRAVDGVSLTIKAGESRGLVGESGCGKSTLARTILRLIEPTDGKINFEGRDVTAMDERELKTLRKNAAMIFQDPFASLNPRYTVRRTLAEPMEIHGIGNSSAERDERAAELLEQVGLDRSVLTRHPHAFSGGQRQRIAIARALSVEPMMLIADEPTSALDVSVQANILNLLQELKDQRNLTLLFISHDLSVVEHVCDRVSVMYLGEIVETAETDDLFTRPNHPYTQSLLTSVPSPDPDERSEFIRLKGDVPNPADPPTGCRFHTRCPENIPPESWRDGQESWRQYVQLKNDIRNDRINVDLVKSRLDSDDLDQFIIETFGEPLSRKAARSVLTALERLSVGDTDESIEVLDERFRSTCESNHPEMLTNGSDGDVRCHLYDPAQPGDPDASDLVQSPKR